MPASHLFVTSKKNKAFKSATVILVIISLGSRVRSRALTCGASGEGLPGRLGDLCQSAGVSGEALGGRVVEGEGVAHFVHDAEVLAVPGGAHQHAPDRLR